MNKNEQISSLPFLRKRDLNYFERAKVVNQKDSSQNERDMIREEGKICRQQMEFLGEELLKQLQPIRDDLKITLQSFKGRHLTENLYLTLTRENYSSKEDAQLYINLQEEGAEVGFGFGLHNKQQEKMRRKFINQFRRFHKKAQRYIKLLQKEDYRLWLEPQQAFYTPSTTLEVWGQKASVIVRLLPRELLFTTQDKQIGIFAQILGELIGLYGFLDRVYTEIPHIRPLHVELPSESEHLETEEDAQQIQNAVSEFNVDFINYARRQNFHFSLELIRSYYLSLQTRSFVILTGVAGTGKSKLAQMFAHFVTQNANTTQGNPHIEFIPVHPDWLDSQGLLGYYDSLTGVYKATPFLRLLLRAHNDPDNPYFAILDEMNLARIEYYFSDFLSLIESRQYDENGTIIDQGKLHLHTEVGSLPIPDPFIELLELPDALAIPKNLYITGTINIDETTHHISPKVLDRANVIEVKTPSPAQYLSWICQEQNHHSTRTLTTIMRQRVAFIRQGHFTTPYSPEQLTLPPERLAKLAAILDTIFDILQKSGFDFGLRLVKEILYFTENHYRLEAESSELNWSLDRQLLQKILPRIHGSRQRLQPLLERLLISCWLPKENIEQKLIPSQVEKHRITALKMTYSNHLQKRTSTNINDNEPLEPPKLRTSALKIAKMLTKLQFEPYVDFYL